MFKVNTIENATNVRMKMQSALGIAEVVYEYVDRSFKVQSYIHFCQVGSGGSRLNSCCPTTDAAICFSSGAGRVVSWSTLSLTPDPRLPRLVVLSLSSHRPEELAISYNRPKNKAKSFVS